MNALLNAVDPRPQPAMPSRSQPLPVAKAAREHERRPGGPEGASKELSFRDELAARTKSESKPDAASAASDDDVSDVAPTKPTDEVAATDEKQKADEADAPVDGVTEPAAAVEVPPVADASPTAKPTAPTADAQGDAAIGPVSDRRPASAPTADVAPPSPQASVAAPPNTPADAEVLPTAATVEPTAAATNGPNIPENTPIPAAVKVEPTPVAPVAATPRPKAPTHVEDAMPVAQAETAGAAGSMPTAAMTASGDQATASLAAIAPPTATSPAPTPQPAAALPQAATPEPDATPLGSRNLENVAAAVKSAAAGGASGGATRQVMTIRLDPPSLGSVRVHVQQVGTSVSATIGTSSEVAHHLVRKSLDQLQSALERQGLTLDRVHVTRMSTPVAEASGGRDAQAQSEQRGEAQSDGREQARQQQRDGHRRDSMLRRWNRGGFADAA